MTINPTTTTNTTTAAPATAAGAEVTKVSKAVAEARANLEFFMERRESTEPKPLYWYWTCVSSLRDANAAVSQLKKEDPAYLDSVAQRLQAIVDKYVAGFESYKETNDYNQHMPNDWGNQYGWHDTYYARLFRMVDEELSTLKEAIGS